MPDSSSSSSIRLAYFQSAPAKMTYSFEDTRALTGALKRGEEAAYSWLYREWNGRISRYSFALAAGEPGTAAEITQAVWLKISRNIRTLKDEAALWNWITCSARHAAIDHHRKGGRYRNTLRRIADRFSPRHPDSEDMETEMIAALDNALSQLDPTQLDIIESRYFAGESLEMIATRHSLTSRAVEGRLARLRQLLRDSIARELKSR